MKYERICCVSIDTIAGVAALGGQLRAEVAKAVVGQEALTDMISICAMVASAIGTARLKSRLSPT